MTNSVSNGTPQDDHAAVVVPEEEPRKREQTVSIQTQTESFDDHLPHTQHVLAAEQSSIDAEGAGVGQRLHSHAAQEFMVHPPAPPQEGATSQQSNDAQELMQVHTSLRVVPSSSIPFGSVLQPVQGTLVHSAAPTHAHHVGASAVVVQSSSVVAQPAETVADTGTARPRASPRKPLTASQKLAIINLHKGKERIGTTELALRFGVQERTIKQICAPQNEEKFLKTLKRPDKLSQEDRAALRRRMISKACTGKSRLTVAQKLEIIKLHETSAGKTGVPAAQLAERYNVAERTIRKICCEKQRERLERFSQSDASIEAMRLCREDLYPDLTKLLLKWVEAQVHSPSSDRPLTQSVILQKAVEIGGELGMTNFKGSKGWMHRWMKRYNIRAIIDGTAMLPSAARAMKEAAEAADRGGGAGDGEADVASGVGDAGGMGLMGMHGQSGAAGAAMSEAAMVSLMGGGSAGAEAVLATRVSGAVGVMGMPVVMADAVVSVSGGRDGAEAREGEHSEVEVADAGRAPERRTYSAGEVRRDKDGQVGAPERETGSGMQMDAERGSEGVMDEGAMVDAGGSVGVEGEMEIEGRGVMETWTDRG